MIQVEWNRSCFDCGEWSDGGVTACCNLLVNIQSKASTSNKRTVDLLANFQLQARPDERPARHQDVFQE